MKEAEGIASPVPDHVVRIELLGYGCQHHVFDIVVVESVSGIGYSALL